MTIGKAGNFVYRKYFTLLLFRSSPLVVFLSIVASDIAYHLLLASFLKEISEQKIPSHKIWEVALFFL